VEEEGPAGLVLLVTVVGRDEEGSISTSSKSNEWEGRSSEDTGRALAGMADVDPVPAEGLFREGGTDVDVLEGEKVGEEEVAAVGAGWFTCRSRRRVMEDLLPTDVALVKLPE
jgi:hypothetical protein